MKEVSESGGLTLQDLSPQQDGVYACEVDSGDEEHTISHFILRVTPGNKSQQQTSSIIRTASVTGFFSVLEKPSSTGSVIVGVVVVFLVAAAVASLVFYCKRKTR